MCSFYVFVQLKFKLRECRIQISLQEIYGKEKHYKVHKINLNLVLVMSLKKLKPSRVVGQPLYSFQHFIVTFALRFFIFLFFLASIHVCMHKNTGGNTFKVTAKFKVGSGVSLKERGVRVCTLCYIIDAPYWFTSSLLCWQSRKQSLIINYSLDDFEQKNDSVEPQHLVALRRLIS